MTELVRIADHKAGRLQVLENVVFGQLEAVSEVQGIVRGRWHKDVRKKALALCRIRDRLMDLGVQPTPRGFENYTISPSCDGRWV